MIDEGREAPQKQGQVWERRRHVRVRPAADYDVIAEVCDGAVFTRVQIVDLSLGGVGLLMEAPVDEFEIGQAFELRVNTPEADSVRVRVVVRHQARGVCGAQFQEPDEAASSALERAVSELLERGHQA